MLVTINIWVPIGSTNDVTSKKKTNNNVIHSGKVLTQRPSYRTGFNWKNNKANYNTYSILNIVTGTLACANVYGTRNPFRMGNCTERKL